VSQRLDGYPSAPVHDRQGLPGSRPLSWWRDNQGRFPLDQHLIPEPCEASSGLTRRGRLVGIDAGLTNPRRRLLRQLMCR
jgi:hypothetical protein